MDRLNLEDCYRGTIDPLSRQEERELIRRYQEEGDMAAREKVVKANLRFVIRVAKEFSRYLPVEDAIGEGSLGLLKALERYDASRGYKFITYAVWWIRQAIHEALRNEGHILRKPQALVGVNERFRQASRALEAEKNRHCIETEVALWVGIVRGYIPPQAETGKSQPGQVLGHTCRFPTIFSRNTEKRWLCADKELSPRTLTQTETRFSN